MSIEAEVVRSRRQIWAASGSPHDRLIRLLQVALPACVGALIAVLLFAPFGHRSEIGFLLAKDRIAVSPQRMRVVAARYTGTDAEGRPFSLTAADAVQHSNEDPVVRMRDLSAMIVMADGPATLAADDGSYDPRTDQVMIDGPLRFVAADGYRLDTGDVTINLGRRELSSGRAVVGDLPVGHFSADSIAADLASRTVRLSGNARLRIDQGVVR